MAQTLRKVRGEPQVNTLTLEAIEETLKDVKKELSIYLRVIAMQSAIRAELHALLEQLEECAYQLGKFDRPGENLPR
jgi:hypothetical protein